MSYKKIVKDNPLPEGADAADFLACRWNTEEVTDWARSVVKLFSVDGEIRPPYNTEMSVLLETTDSPQKNENAPHDPAPVTLSSKRPVNLTDLGNARRLVAKHGADMRYCYTWKRWLIWNGKRWIADDVGESGRRAKDTILTIYEAAVDAKEQEVREKIIKHALKSEASSYISAMLSLAESEPGISILPEQLDTDPWLLNCDNGTLDLRTGELRPHRREDYITKLVPVVYHPDAPCNLWNNFLTKIMNGNAELVQFLQRAVGYALTAQTTEQVLFFLYGTGANGKSTFLETIKAVLGDYAQQMPTDTLMAKDKSSIPNDIARLKGARFVAAMETEEGKRLSEVQVKQLTGGDTLSARFMRAEFFDFTPSHKLFVGTNHKPLIRGTDYAIWRRIRLIPFIVTIPPEERDKDLLVKLRIELSGILAWAVRGCLDWKKNGLGEPDAVKGATESYRKDMDILSDFLDERCVSGAGLKVKASDLYAEYKNWSDASGEYPVTQTRFGTQMVERGFEKKKSDGIIWYLAIGLRNSEKDSGRYGD